jgi:hypothetical protein
MLAAVPDQSSASALRLVQLLGRHHLKQLQPQQAVDAVLMLLRAQQELQQPQPASAALQ